MGYGSAPSPISWFFNGLIGGVTQSRFKRPIAPKRPILPVFLFNLPDFASLMLRAQGRLQVSSKQE